MQSFGEITNKVSFKSKIVKQELGLKCERCGRKYDYFEFANGQVVKDGCDCEMIALAKQSTENYYKKQRKIKAERIFNQSIMNEDLKKASFDNYEPTNKQLDYAKQLCQRYASNFNLDNKQSLLIQGSFGTGKSHLSMSIVKTVKAKGYTVLYMNVPQLISTIKNTYSNQTAMTEQELARIVSDVDLMVFDDYGINMNDFATSKMFELIVPLIAIGIGILLGGISAFIPELVTELSIGGRLLAGLISGLMATGIWETVRTRTGSTKDNNNKIGGGRA